MTTSPSRLRLSLCGLLLAGSLPLAGCNHRDPVETVGDWYHQAQGGVIAQRRPPPPGAQAAYPHVGMTPTTPVDVPSPNVRASITEGLVEDRNYVQRLAAANGPLPVAPPKTPAKTPAKPAPKPAPATPAPGPGKTAAPDAAPAAAPADQPSAVDPTRSAMSFTAPGTSTPTAAPAKKPAAPPLAMPAVTIRPVTDGANTPLPQIPAAPPPPPQFPGYEAPSDFNLPDAPRPALSLADPGGTLVRFSSSSDVFAGNPEKALGKIISLSHGGTIYVRGFGEAQSLSAADQARGITLGLARALKVAQALQARGVAASSLMIEADALGDGVRAGSSP